MNDSVNDSKLPFLARLPEIAVGGVVAALMWANLTTLNAMQVDMAKLSGQVQLIEDRQLNSRQNDTARLSLVETTMTELAESLNRVWPRYRELLQNVDKIADKADVELTWRYN